MPVGDAAPTFGTPGDDALGGTAGVDRIIGGDGHDALVGGDGLDGGSGGDALLGQNGGDSLFGDGGDDLLEGGDGDDLVAGGPGTDRLTGGGGADAFRFDGYPFQAAAPTAPAAGAIAGSNLPDSAADPVVGEDRCALDGSDLGLRSLAFANGTVGGLAGDANALVPQGSFANAGAAARAIADNEALAADAGVFVYHNGTLRLHRLV